MKSLLSVVVVILTILFSSTAFAVADHPESWVKVAERVKAIKEEGKTVPGYYVEEDAGGYYLYLSSVKDEGWWEKDGLILSYERNGVIHVCMDPLSHPKWKGWRLQKPTAVCVQRYVVDGKYEDWLDIDTGRFEGKPKRYQWSGYVSIYATAKEEMKIHAAVDKAHEILQKFSDKAGMGLIFSPYLFKGE